MPSALSQKGDARLSCKRAVDGNCNARLTEELYANISTTLTSHKTTDEACEATVTQDASRRGNPSRWTLTRWMCRHLTWTIHNHHQQQREQIVKTVKGPIIRLRDMTDDACVGERTTAFFFPCVSYPIQDYLSPSKRLFAPVAAHHQPPKQERTFPEYYLQDILACHLNLKIARPLSHSRVSEPGGLTGTCHNSENEVSFLRPGSMSAGLHLVGPRSGGEHRRFDRSTEHSFFHTLTIWE